MARLRLSPSGEFFDLPLQNTFTALLITGTVTLLPFQIALVNPTGAITVNFPASPANGEQVGVKSKTAAQSIVTIDGNGNDVENPLSGVFAATFLASQPILGTAFGLLYTFDGTDWMLL